MIVKLLDHHRADVNAVPGFGSNMVYRALHVAASLGNICTYGSFPRRKGGRRDPQATVAQVIRRLRPANHPIPIFARPTPSFSRWNIGRGVLKHKSRRFSQFGMDNTTL